MTDTHLTEWPSAFENYRQTSLAAVAGFDRAEVTDDDEADSVMAENADAAEQAAMALLYTPACDVLHVVQKIRVVQKFLYMGGMHPDLADMLTNDLESLIVLKKH